MVRRVWLLDIALGAVFVAFIAWSRVPLSTWQTFVLAIPLVVTLILVRYVVASDIRRAGPQDQKGPHEENESKKGLQRKD